MFRLGTLVEGPRLEKPPASEKRSEDTARRSCARATTAAKVRSAISAASGRFLFFVNVLGSKACAWCDGSGIHSSNRSWGATPERGFAAEG